MTEIKTCNDKVWLGVMGVVMIMILALLMIRNHFFKIIDYVTAEYTGYYAIEGDEYCAVLQIKDNDEVSYFTTQGIRRLDGCYAEGKLKRAEDGAGISLESEDESEMKYRIIATFSGDGKKLCLFSEDGMLDGDFYEPVSKKKYESLFLEISDILYERYCENR